MARARAPTRDEIKLCDNFIGAHLRRITATTHTRNTNHVPYSITRQNTTAAGVPVSGGSAGDPEVAAIHVRDEIVIGVWMNTLPPAIEQDLKTRATSTGTWSGSSRA